MVAMGLGYSILNQRPRIRQTYTGERTTILEISDSVPTLQVAVSSLARSGRTAQVAAVTEIVREILAEVALE